MKTLGEMESSAGRETPAGFADKVGRARTKICPNCGEELEFDMEDDEDDDKE